MQWYNEPPAHSHDEGVITVRVGAKTDFWQKTHYNFTPDNGHFYYETVSGDFTASVKVVGVYTALYDQAGLMIRTDAEHWIKTGIEYLDGVQHASAVVTRVYSDWSVVALPANPAALWLKLKREGDSVEISYSLDGELYQLLRLAYFAPGGEVQIGVMCAAPQGEGFDARFEGYVCEATHG